MSWTKKEIIEQAFDTIGLASYNFDLEPEQFESALKKLDAMFGTWNGYGIRLAYPTHDTPANSDITSDSEIPDWAFEAAYLNLAIRIAPSYGKAISPDVKQFAKSAYNNILNKTTQIKEYQIQDLPRGQGSKYWRYAGSRTLPKADEPLTDGSNEEIDFN